MENGKRQKEQTEPKKDLLSQFEVVLFDFWGEEPTRTAIKKAWGDFLDAVAENEIVPKEYYKLTKAERENLYKLAGV